MTILSQPALSAKPDVAKASQRVIAAAAHFMMTVSGSFAEREQALLAVLQEGGRVVLEQDLQRMEDALPAEVAVGSDQRVYRDRPWPVRGRERFAAAAYASGRFDRRSALSTRAS